MIDRPLYMEKLVRFQNPSLVKVLVGVRRCGKSSLLRLLNTHLMSIGVPESSILDINFEKPSFLELQNPTALFEYVRQHLPAHGPQFLFIDEVQELDEWAKTVNGLRTEFEHLDLYVTGSNARMFSGEYLTYLSGRYVQIEVYPLSFAEFLSFKDTRAFPPCRKIPLDELDARFIETRYQQYITEGSFPAVALAPNQALSEAMLGGLFDSVFTRDILLRGGIRNESTFLRVARFALDNIGNQTSANAIANTLKSSGHAVTADTVDSYLSLMCNAYLLYRCDRYDIRGKERLRTNGKYFVVDQGLRNQVIGLRTSDRGHVTENLVYLELLRRGFNVSVGTFVGAEIDFIASRGDTRYYIQVSESVVDPNVLERETKPFSKLRDHHPRIIITKDWDDTILDNGILHINVYDFLLGREL